MADAGPDGALRELAALAPAAWLVGGAVRDRLLGRDPTDFDVAVAGDARELSRSLARRLDAHRFGLSDAFGAWRVLSRDRRWQVDLLPLMGPTIEDDLAHRDLTINAIAEPLAGGGRIDPFHGAGDIAAHRLRMVGPGAFAEDPLRVLRLARHGCELGFEVEPETCASARACAPALRAVAGERVFAELRRVIGAERALDGLALMERLGATAAVLPELEALRDIRQSQYHHLDVLGHTMSVLDEAIALERDPTPQLGAALAAPVRALLAEPLADGLTRGEALRLGALLHDIAKPRTRSETAEGRVTFLGHDVAGAEMGSAILRRLRASERLVSHVAALTRHHLRLGFLVHEMPLGPRATYRYLQACEPVEVDVSLLSVADRLATRGRGAPEAIERHLTLARELVAAGLRWRAARPRPPLRGDELAREVGVAPGPRLGWLLRELELAAYAGEIGSRGEAVARARQLLAADSESADR
jgi:putative nucleotidyltransferase with HDIG domain